jgi:hypothetical protein
MLRHIAAVLALSGSLVGAAGADDWSVARLRGVVLELRDGKWEKLERFDVIPDDRLVRSLRGWASFVRDQERIDIGPDTIIQIMDKEGRDYTTVVNHLGTVSIDAEARNVEHFSVVTPHLAAVVKGTAFTVGTNQANSSLEVTRGEVLMRDTAFDRLITVGSGERVQTGSGPAQIETASPPPVSPLSAPPQSIGSSGGSSIARAPVQQPSPPAPSVPQLPQGPELEEPEIEAPEVEEPEFEEPGQEEPQEPVGEEPQEPIGEEPVGEEPVVEEPVVEEPKDPVVENPEEPGGSGGAGSCDDDCDDEEDD